ncbi:salivary glue protein Sgs-5 [Drosophila ficusphila]|uniref:salivary glue protein Sgs-5 n=1 Tax=Drosophila ficusphila TaxID=30025 RepID=UPI0007E6C6AD|nr:salivary glue protein Sgs-5 [Drosophila ficusphila]
MNFSLYLFSVLLCGFFPQNKAQTRNCTNACISRARCNPYYKNLVWAIEGRMCRVFQNGCLFGNENCMRANQCQRPLVATSKERCMEFCPRMCYRGAPRVCGWFPQTLCNGTNVGREMTFGTRCFLDMYACRNAEAYVNEPRNGPCSR